MSKYRVGIDLGTTNTVCATYTNSFDFIKCGRSYILPSVLMYKDGKITIGEAAKKRALRNPDNIISSSKTSMGDFSKKWKIEDKEFTPTDVAEEILSQIRLAAQKYFDTEEDIDAVITVPAYFTASQSDETKKAAEKAGLNVLEIITEPVAAAIAYGLEDDVDSVFVVDIGGGTFDICLLEVSLEGGRKKFKTKFIDGDARLGGDDFDNIVEGLCHSQLRQKHGIDLSSLEKSGLDAETYGQAKQKIRQKAEQAKIALSDAEETNIEIANLCEKNGSPVNFLYELTRIEFEKSCMPLFNKIKRTINRCIENNNIDVSKIGKVIFVGGSANIPYMRTIVLECLEQEPYSDEDLAKLVAKGAALCAAENSTGISTVIIEDILAHSLGIEIEQEDNGKTYKYYPILEKGESYPISKSHAFYTVNDYQKIVGVNVYEGENLENLAENTYYGGFELTNIKQAPAGVPIEVTFDINQSRQLIVTARDEATGSEKSIEIKKSDKPIKIERKIERKRKPLKISVTTKNFDDIGSILSSKNIAYSSFNSIGFDCDILFINCCTHDSIDEDNLRKFVENGGCLYASCFADEKVKRAFPGLLVSKHDGAKHDELVSVEDEELKSIVGSSIPVKFDTLWAQLYSAPSSNCILRSSIGAKRPIMVSFKYGKGMIFFTCFHNHVQTSEKEKALLQLMVLRQIGMHRGMTIVDTGKALSVNVDDIRAKFRK